MTERKITFQEFREKVGNLNIDDEELSQYFREYEPRDGDPDDNVGPNIMLDNSKVEIENVDDPRVESALMLNSANTLARFRRRLRFERSMRQNATSSRKVLVTEGDSWFQFPFLLRDIIDHLSERYNVYSTGAGSDTTLNMVFENPEYLDALIEATGIAKREPDGFVFSSGGNDLLGEENGERLLAKIVRKHEPGEEFELANAYDNAKLQGQLNLVRSGYQQIISDINRSFPKLPIFLHGYDRVWPVSNENGDQRRKGRWVAEPLRKQGVTSFAHQREITTDLLSRLLDIIEDLSAEHATVHVLRTTLPLQDRLDLWHDEIHPTSDGFESVAAEFVETIDRVLATT